ncbi:efflux RND transporter permease subunit [Thiocapsa marina]|uniref:Acriflavin resistance protein n=1 Tax=Thiocapsa marina 5811 TaxID=768671 RepID=F9UD64_9GAMM|nr:efflux RND transporter permease subunit [Thiocapsa marina]EGV17808.1 acriflavin resistance protein [Thiocapsa marina 5811]
MSRSDAGPPGAPLNLSALAVRERSVTLFLILVTAVAGLVAFLQLGRAEDPAFTVRVMVVSALWPGASAQQMQDLVADPLEKRIGEVELFYRLETTARPGRVDMLVEFQDYAPSEQIPDLFYQVRKRMSDAAGSLPAGVLGPFVNDDFSDVYFALYALTAPDLPNRLLVREAERIRDRLARVEGVQKARILGERPQRFFVELDQARLATLGVSPADVREALDAQNRLAPAGLVETDGPRLYLRPDAELRELEDIRHVPLRIGGHLLTLGEIAEVSRGYEDPPEFLIRAGGEDAVLLGVVMQRGENGLSLGERLSALQDELEVSLPLGVGFTQLTNQADAITHAVDLFQIKFLVAVAVVMLVSFVAIGWRAGLVVGIAIPLTLGLTFLLMLIRGINLDRVSLGALIISLGLLVDDAIIAIEMMLVKMEAGWDRLRAAAHAWTVTAAPMLSGTLVTVIGFVPIGFARSGVGEYAGNIFWVLAFALLASWVVAVTFTPYLGTVILKAPPTEGTHGSESAYATPLYGRLRGLIRGCVRYKIWVVAATFGLLVLSIVGLAGSVQKQFFPSSDRPEVLIDIRLPEGSAIRATAAVVERVEAILAEAPGVRSSAAYLGAGAPRFFLALNPEFPNPAFAKLIVVAEGAAERDALIAQLQSHIEAGEFPEARVRVHKLLYGPPVIWPVTFRVVGPDPLVLRGIAEQVRDVVAANPNSVDPHLDWSERVPVVRLALDPERLRLIGLTPRELAGQLEYQLSGLPATEIREDIRNVQLILRGVSQNGPASAEDAEAGFGAGGSGAAITPTSLAGINLKTLDGQTIPLEQAGELMIAFEDPVLKRYNREPFIAVQSEVQGAQPPNVTQAIWSELQGLIAELPPGYRIDIGGAVEQSGKADASIQRVQPIMLVLMLIVIMVQMRSFSGTLMVVATAPLGVIGATLALLIADRPFGFVALLGLIGLAGILMRNTLILAKQIEDNLHQGLERSAAVVEATVQRARPVVLTAAAAVFAFIPLTTDTFWGPLAFVLIGGVLVGTLITLLFLPALYALWFRVRLSSADSPSDQRAVQTSAGSGLP